MSKKFSIMIAVLISMTMVFASCSSNKPKVKKEVPVEVFKIGVVLSIADNLLELGAEVKKSMQFAVDVANRGERLKKLNRKIELVIENDEGKPDKARKVTNKLINNDNVHIIIGSLTPSCTDAIAKEIKDKKVLMFAMNTDNDKITEIDNNIFRMRNSEIYQARQMANYLIGKKVRRVGIVYEPTDKRSNDLKDFFKIRFEEQGGKIILEEEIDPRSYDYQAALNNIITLAPDFVFLPIQPDISTRFIRQARDNGVWVDFGSTDIWEGIEETMVDEVVDSICLSYFQYDGSGNSKRFIQAFEEEFAQKPRPISAFSYDTVNLFAQNLSKIDKYSIEGMKKAIIKARIDVVTGDIRFTDRKNAVRNVYVVSIQRDSDGLLTLKKEASIAPEVNR